MWLVQAEEQDNPFDFVRSAAIHCVCFDGFAQTLRLKLFLTVILLVFIIEYVCRNPQ